MAPNNAQTMVSFHHPQRLPMEGLQRAISDLSSEMSKEAMNTKLPTISEVEDAKCECCGMSEECTQGYIARVKEKYYGRWICGLCCEAVEEEAKKRKVMLEEALKSHMVVCDRFNRIGRRQPLLGQAAAMGEILKKCSRQRAKSSSPRENINVGQKKGVITRSSSCIPAITRDI